MTHLDPDPLDVTEPEPSHLSRAADSAFGCGALLLLALLLIAAPRPELHVIPASGPRIALSAPWSSSSESGNLGASTGAPHVREALDPGDGSQTGNSPENPVTTALTTGGAPRPAVAHAAIPMPAIFQTTATWCAPTPTLCHGWGGNAKLAALPGFHGKPYRILVTYGSRAVIVTVVSVCWCGVDLSPSAFASLAPLSKGRIVVTVQGPIADAPLPATDSVGPAQ